jgi:hypothetical protein
MSDGNDHLRGRVEHLEQKQADMERDIVEMVRLVADMDASLTMELIRLRKRQKELDRVLLRAVK